MRAIDKLNDLIRLDLDAVGAYTAAIEASEKRHIKSTLEAFRRDHQRHIRDLSDMVVRLGGAPARHRDVKGILILGFTMLASRGDHSALMAMRGNEELTNRVYEGALDAELGADARKLVTRNYQDEQRHLSWIKDALERRLWEHADEAVRATGTHDAAPVKMRSTKVSTPRGKPSSRRRARRSIAH